MSSRLELIRNPFNFNNRKSLRAKKSPSGKRALHTWPSLSFYLSFCILNLFNSSSPRPAKTNSFLILLCLNARQFYSSRESVSVSLFLNPFSPRPTKSSPFIILLFLYARQFFSSRESSGRKGIIKLSFKLSVTFYS